MLRLFFIVANDCEADSYVFAVSPVSDKDAPTEFSQPIPILSSAVAAVIGVGNASGTIVDDDAPRAFATRPVSLDLSALPGSVVVRWTAIPGRFYAVEMSQDLITWQVPLGHPLMMQAGSEHEQMSLPITSDQVFVRVADVPVTGGTP